ncbi:MAG: hypothetical protein KAS21_09890 [Candidatus Aminicenantes bacterium]|nr:hypothetical protein [Candidatus Aminicenantes bacterium]
MKKLLLILLMLSFTQGLPSETQVSVSVSSTNATIGERITLKFIARTSAESDSIKISQGKPDFDFISEAELSISENDGVKTFEKEFDISFFKTGEYNVGPFNISLIKKGEIVENFLSNTIPVNIRSVLEKDDKDIKPLKDLSEIKGNPFYLLKYLLFALIIIIIIFLIVFFLNRRKKGEAQNISAPLHPEVEFKNRIESLWRSDLFNTGKTKKFFMTLTESYKIFMTRLYNFNAEDLTSYEIMCNLRNFEKDEKITGNFDQVFLISDLSKFAKYAPAESEVEEVRANLFRIIEIIGERRRKEEEEKTDAPL